MAEISEICNLQFGIWDLGFGIWDLGFGAEGRRLKLSLLARRNSNLEF